MKSTEWGGNRGSRSTEDCKILLKGERVCAWRALHFVPLACRTSVGRTFPLRALTVLCCLPPLLVSLLCVLNGGASPLLMVKIEFLTGATLLYVLVGLSLWYLLKEEMGDFRIDFYLFFLILNHHDGGLLHKKICMCSRGACGQMGDWPWYQLTPMLSSSYQPDKHLLMLTGASRTRRLNRCS